MSDPPLAASAPVLIVGAGPAGLAVAACLGRAGVGSLILERADDVASSWRRHYDRLHLHTSKGFSNLPYLPFPRSSPRYPSRRQVVDYLESYSRRFELEIQCGQPVVSASRRNGDWEVRTERDRFHASHLVVATGYCREPQLPQWPGSELYRGEVLHSSAYKNGEPFRDRSVLVVGFGNSGGEIALDLWEHGARPSIAVRGPVNVIPRDLLGIPILALGILQSKLPAGVADAMNAPLMRVVVGDLTRYGLRKLPHGPVRQIEEHNRVPLIDVGTIDLIKKGELPVFPGLERFTEGGVVFTDGCEKGFDAVVLATGYRPRVDRFLEGADAALDAEGSPHTSGTRSEIEGLYFCGFRNVRTGVLREIGIEARRIAKAIAAAR